MTPENRAIAEKLDNPFVSFLKPYAAEATQIRISFGNSNRYTIEVDVAGETHSDEVQVPISNLALVKEYFDEYVENNCPKITG